MEKEKILVYIKPNSNQYCKKKLGDFTDKYISVEALKEIINGKITETQRYDTEVGWNSALRNILNELK